MNTYLGLYHGPLAYLSHDNATYLGYGRHKFSSRAITYTTNPILDVIYSLRIGKMLK